MWRQLRVWGQMDLSLNPSVLSPKARPLISVSSIWRQVGAQGAQLPTPQELLARGSGAAGDRSRALGTGQREFGLWGAGERVAP